MSKCTGCGKDFNNLSRKEINLHVKNCKLYKQKIKEIKDKLTYDFLYDEYIVKEKSMRQIAKELGLSKPRLIEQKIKEYSIKVRSKSESRFAKGYIEQCKTTSQKRYGKPYHTMKGSSIFNKISNGVKEKYNVDNVSQIPEVKEKIKQTNLQRYGVENVSQSSIIQQRRKQTVKEKYNVDNVFQVPQIIDKIKQTKQHNGIYTHTSQLADNFLIQLANFIDDNEHIYYHPKTKEYSIYFNQKLYCYDFVDTLNKKCIEINGNYWHANPKIYSPDWINPHKQITAQQIWNNDEKKYDIIKEQRGYELLIIWEDEIHNDIKLALQKCINFLKGIT